MAPEYDFSRAERGRYAGRFYVDPSTVPGTYVILRRPFPENGLRRGDVGRILEAYGDLLEVEFLLESGDVAIVELEPGDLRLPGTGEDVRGLEE